MFSYGLNLFVIIASTYLESKDEVHDFASLRHAVLEQVDKPLQDAEVNYSNISKKYCMCCFEYHCSVT
jgi:hypothetical protein